jgi:1,4-dihydroxy-2-naphthoyl-CoA hydrolase
VKITVTPELLSENSFAIRFEVVRTGTPDKTAARVRTEHVCTSLTKRARVDLPAALAAWVKAK